MLAQAVERPEATRLERAIALTLATVTLLAALPAGLAAVGEPTLDLRLHPSTRIVGDAQLDAAHGVSGGSGTPEDPYVIRDRTFALAPERYGLSLVGTRAHVVIENVAVEGVVGNPESYASCNASLATKDRACHQSAGIELDGAQNVTIRGFRMNLSGIGIFARESERIAIESSEFSQYLAIYATGVGIWLSGGRDVTLRDLRVYGEASPLVVRGTQDVRVEGGRWDGDGFRPLAYDADGLRVEGAQLPDGFYVESTERVRFVRNELEDRLALVSEETRSDPFHTRGVLVCGNAWRTPRPALSTYGVSDARVLGNAFLSASHPFLVEDSEDMEIARNRFVDATAAAWLEGTKNVVVHDNSFGLGTKGLDATTDAKGDARGNWWGHASGPAPAGSGVPAPTKLPVAPWLAAEPDLAVDCDAVPTPEPAHWLDHVDAHVFPGNSAVTVRWDSPANTSIAFGRSVVTSDGADFGTMDFFAKADGDLIGWGRYGDFQGIDGGAGAGGIPGVSNVVVDSPVSTGGMFVASSWGCGATPCKGMAVFLSGFSDPTGHAVLSIVSRTKDHGVTIEVSDRVGFVSRETMDGPNAYAKAGTGVTVGALQTKTFTVEKELWGWAALLATAGQGGETWARNGPGGQKTMSNHVDWAGPPGTYTWRHTAARTGESHPVGLWADVDLPDHWAWT